MGNLFRAAPLWIWVRDLECSVFKVQGSRFRIRGLKVQFCGYDGVRKLTDLRAIWVSRPAMAE